MMAAKGPTTLKNGDKNSLRCLSSLCILNSHSVSFDSRTQLKQVERFIFLPPASVAVFSSQSSTRYHQPVCHQSDTSRQTYLVKSFSEGRNKRTCRIPYSSFRTEHQAVNIIFCNSVARLDRGIKPGTVEWEADALTITIPR